MARQGPLELPAILAAPAAVALLPKIAAVHFKHSFGTRSVKLTGLHLHPGRRLCCLDTTGGERIQRSGVRKIR